MSHRFSGGKVVAPATKGGAAFPSPVRAVVKVLSKEGSYNILKEPHHPPQGGIYICAEGGRLATLAPPLVPAAPPFPQRSWGHYGC